MTFTEVFTLLQLAISLLIAASGPNVPPALEEQAKTVANYAITVANQSLAKDPTLGGTKPSDSPPIPNVQIDSNVSTTPTPAPATAPTPVAAAVTIDIALNASAGSELDEHGRKNVYVAVTGNWDKASVFIWYPNGEEAATLGMNKPVSEDKSRGNRVGHFIEFNSTPLGTYEWKVTAEKGNTSSTEEGEFIVD